MRPEASVKRFSCRRRTRFSSTREWNTLPVPAVRPPGEDGDQQLERRAFITAGIYATDPDFMLLFARRSSLGIFGRESLRVPIGGGTVACTIVNGMLGKGGE